MLKVVQGDVFEICIELCWIEKDLIDSVRFSSEALGEEQVAELCGNSYRVRFDGPQTARFPPGFARYDITVGFIDGTSLTVQYHEKIEVLRKVNGRRNE